MTETSLVIISKIEQQDTILYCCQKSMHKCRIEVPSFSCVGLLVYLQNHTMTQYMTAQLLHSPSVPSNRHNTNLNSAQSPLILHKHSLSSSLTLWVLLALADIIFMVKDIITHLFIFQISCHLFCERILPSIRVKLAGRSESLRF